MAIPNHTTTTRSTTINNHSQHLSSPPPPPPFNYNPGPTFSPLLMVISSGVLVAFLAVSCYAIISKYCLNTTNTNQQEQNSSTSSGLDKSVMEKIMPHSYKASDAPIIGTVCAICLAEFSDSESLRCLPHCGHAFHVPCIDSWLKLHSNCPVCRACIVSSTTSTVAIITDEGETSVRNSDVDIV